MLTFVQPSITSTQAGSIGWDFNTGTGGITVLGGEVKTDGMEIDDDGYYDMDNVFIGHSFTSTPSVDVERGTGTTYLRYCGGLVTINSGSTEASDNDNITHGLSGTPDIVLLTVAETDARYIVQWDPGNSDATTFQLYLYDETAESLEAVDKTITWTAIYNP